MNLCIILNCIFIYFMWNIYSIFIFNNEKANIIIKKLDIDDKILEKINNSIHNYTIQQEFNRPLINFTHYSAESLPHSKMKKYIPKVVDYYNNIMPKIISNVLNKTVYPINRKATCMLLSYNQENDYVDFHYDSGTSYGKYLINVIIHIKSTPNSCSNFQYMDYINGKRKIKKIKMSAYPKKSVLIYQGSNLFHGVTKQCKNQNRTVWIMSFVIDNKKPDILNRIINYLYDIGYNGFN